ncbi:MAG: AtpZ/AtpI family protein [Chloroflexota bacterium]
MDLAEARMRATEALTRRGYTITADGGQDGTGVPSLEFTRGSRLRSVVAMSPDSWYVTGRVDFGPEDDRDGSGRVKVEINASRSAQVPSEAERAYWDREAAFVANAAAGDDEPVLRPDTSPIRRQSLIAIGILIGAVAVGAIIGNRVDDSDGSAALIFAIVGLLVGCLIVWRWLGLKEERARS